MKKLLLTLLLGTMLMTTSSQAATDITGIQDFVSRFYVEVLDRTPDQAGLDDWVNRLASGESAGSDVATGFIFSQEFIDRDVDNTTYLNILYRAFFDREADEGGMTGWLGELEQGTSREDVLNGFLFSTEFDNLCKAYGIKTVPDGVSLSTGSGVEDFVKRFYSEVLGRTADAAGLADWVSRLNEGTSTGADIASGFIFSEEFIARDTADVAFVEILYKAFFGRDADEGGLSGWLDKLEQGVSREDVLDGFLLSDEFVYLSADYGIIAFDGAPVLSREERVENSDGSYEVIIYTYYTSGTTRTVEYTLYYPDNTVWEKEISRFEPDGRESIFEFEIIELDGSWYRGTETYDENEMVITETWEKSDGTSGVTHFTYHSNGNIATRDETRYNDPEVGSISHYITTYDENEIIIKTDHLMTAADGSWFKTISILDGTERKNPLTETWERSNGKSGVIYYTYHTNGNIATRDDTNYNYIEPGDSAHFLTNFDENGLTTASTYRYTSSDGAWSYYIYDYDGSGWKVSGTYTASDDSYGTITLTNYSNGVLQHSLTEHHYIDPSGTPGTCIMNSYFDTNGNEIKDSYTHVCT